MKAQEDIKWSNHLVFVYPTWWATPPALLKAFIESTRPSSSHFSLDAIMVAAAPYKSLLTKGRHEHIFTL